MNDCVICGLIGFFVGGIIGGCLIGRVCGREYQRRIEALQNERDTLIDKGRKAAEKSLAERQRADEEAEAKLDRDLKDIADLKTLEKLSREYRSDSFDEHFADRAHPEDDEPDIRIITAEQFKHDLNERDSETITYYQEDGVLTDSAQEVVHDQAAMLGEEAMGMIDETQDDFVYIDNEADDILYEVVVEHKMSYYRDVLGI